MTKETFDKLTAEYRLIQEAIKKNPTLELKAKLFEIKLLLNCTYGVVPLEPMTLRNSNNDTNDE